MKKFNELTAGDFFYKARINTDCYDNIRVTSVDEKRLLYGYGESIKRQDLFGFKSDSYIYYTSEEQMYRYCRAQSVKIILSKIESVKKEIENIRKYKLERYDILNTEYINKEINKLDLQISNH